MGLCLYLSVADSVASDHPLRSDGCVVVHATESAPQ